jgi:acetate kinase
VPLRARRVLVVNCGSSSIKLALIDADTGQRAWHALAERLGSEDAQLTAAGRTYALPGADHERALEAGLAELPAQPIAAVGHRVVHGGETFSESVVLDQIVIDAIEACSDLAPLHNPANLAGIRAALRKLPALRHVAVFDTAFHHSLPAHAYLYGLPFELYQRHRIRRYGFHGTSHRYVAGVAAQLLGRPLDQLYLLTAHLGNGASACAIARGRSADTTMGFTPLEGLVMGTRSGDVDPNLHAFLVDHLGMSLSAVGELLNQQSGLLGISGASNDMRNLLELECQGHERAHLAIEVFCYRLARALLGLTAGLPTLDALVFTGGIGEHAAPIRDRTLRAMPLLGVTLDPTLNAAHGRNSHGVISHDSSRIQVLVIPTNEELVIARDTLRAAGG